MCCNYENQFGSSRVMKTTELKASASKNSSMIARTPYNFDVSKFKNENDLEMECVRKLMEVGYAERKFKNLKELLDNARIHIERINHIEFKDDEWERYCQEYLTNPSHNQVDKTRIFHSEAGCDFTLNNGKTVQIKLVDKSDYHKNHYEVMRQVSVAGLKEIRYDTVLLVNGIPAVLIELKKLNISEKEAYNQIRRYKREGFGADGGIFMFISMFVMSNGKFTKIMANTVKEEAIKRLEEENRGGVKKDDSQHRRKVESIYMDAYSKAFNWSDVDNKPYINMGDVIYTLLSPKTLFDVVFKKSIVKENGQLIIPRGYQYSALEVCLNRIRLAHNNRLYGTIDAGGYIYHSTGSGKTILSFLLSRSASKLSFINKVFVVVDRRDLDSKTVKEFQDFEAGCVAAIDKTVNLAKAIEDPNARIIVVSIQKLNGFLKANPDHPILNKECVFIFDECQRSQFGDMHQLIKSKFKKHYFFGLTGTPIFAENARVINGMRHTTEELFGKRLSKYDLMQSINENKTLPFRVSEISTMKKVTEGEFNNAYYKSEAHMRNVCTHILKNFDTYTNRHNSKNKKYNALFTTANVLQNTKYNEMLTEMMEQMPEEKRLTIFSIFSANPNDEFKDDYEEELLTETEALTSREFLSEQVKKFNKHFGTNHDSYSEKGQENYKDDVRRKFTEGKIDMVIVVNMLTVGYDSARCSTVFCDRFLTYQQLLQTAARANRPDDNELKPYANFISYRPVMKDFDDALLLFCGEIDRNIVFAKTFEEYYNGYTDDKQRRHHGYLHYALELKKWLEEVGEDIAFAPTSQKVEFVKLYNEFIKLKRTLDTFPEFTPDKRVLSIADEAELAAYYNEVRVEYKRANAAVQKEYAGVEFELRPISNVIINNDYLFNLIQKAAEARRKKDMAKFAELKLSIESYVSRAYDLEEVRTLIMNFVDNYSSDLNNMSQDVYTAFIAFMKEKSKDFLDELISRLGLKPIETRAYLERAFREDSFDISGEELTRLIVKLPKLKFGSESKERSELKARVKNELITYFDIFNRYM